MTRARRGARSTPLLVAALLIGVMAFTGPVARAEFSGTNREKCERQLFDLGDSLAEVRLACGNPSAEDHWTEYDEEHARGRRGRPISRDRLIYNFGPNQFLRIFEFANGVLVRQTTGHYGYEE